MSKRRSSVVSVHEVGEWPELPMQSDRVLAVIETAMAEVLDELLGPLP
jgi:hypothetical protein